MHQDIETLLERLERVKLAWNNAPEPDPLSISLMQFEREMAALNAADIAALAKLTTEDGNPILTPEQAKNFALSFVR